MPKKDERKQSRPGLPEEVRILISRKLRHLRREQERRWAGVMQTAYSRMHEKISANIKIGRWGRAFDTVPVSVYREIVANAVAMTKEWPGIVWTTMADILEKAQVGPVDGQYLNAIVDGHAWKIGQSPFMLDYIDSKRFKESVQMAARRYGMDLSPSFERRLSMEATAGQCGVKNTARQEREGVGIAIAEFVIGHGLSTRSMAGSDGAPKSSVRREARKIETRKQYKVWQKAYRDLKKARPGMSGVWYSLQIAKTDNPQGHSAETIRKHMKG